MEQGLTEPYELGEALKDLVEEGMPDVSGLYADLLNGALSEVDWQEIGENLITYKNEG